MIESLIETLETREMLNDMVSLDEEVQITLTVVLDNLFDDTCAYVSN